MIRLMELLEEDGVEFDARWFSSLQGIDGLYQPFVGVITIIFTELTVNSHRVLNTEYTLLLCILSMQDSLCVG